ncbi:histidinol-phosphate transaminase [Frateuria aurantia]
MSILDRARAEIRAMQPYASARLEASGGSVMLNANELGWAPEGQFTDGCNRYPDPQPGALVQTLATLYRVRPDQLLVGRGSDEAIDLLVRAFCRAGQDAVIINPPTFGMYAISARIQDAAVIEVALSEDFSLDPDAVLAAWTPAVKLVFICGPNNPTGRSIQPQVIERLAEGLRDKAVLVVDEAYMEFANSSVSASALLGRHDHVAVLRTLSKAWGLAGARVGCLLADAGVIDLLRRIMAPYPLPVPSIRAALEALSPSGQALARQRVATVLAERERLITALQGRAGVRSILASDANFIAVRFDDPAEVYRRLLAAGIVVRDIRKYPRLGDALRISIGTPEENHRLLEAIEASLGVEGQA